MKAVVLGAGGQLGSDLVEILGDRVVGAYDRRALDVTDTAATRAAIPAGGVVFNAAAYTNVDGAETDEDAAYAVNAVGPENLALACREAGATLVHVSTDYVFAGDAEEPYPVDAPVAPRSAYGRTKLAGEQAVLGAGALAYVVRTAWVYGATGSNFVKTMARLEREREALSVVDDQRGSPTWSLHLARGLVELAESGAAPGIYHCTGGGDTTWCGLAKAVFEELGADPNRVKPITTAEFPRPAPRPAYSVLSDAEWRAAGLRPMPHWREALAEAFRRAGDALRA